MASATLTFDPAGFSISAVSFNDNTNYVEILKLTVPITLRGLGCILLGTVATQALTHFKMSYAAVPDGTHIDVVTDTGFNTASNIVPFCSANPHLTAAAGTFMLILGKLPAEVKLWAKNAAAGTLAFVGTAIVG